MTLKQQILKLIEVPVYPLSYQEIADKVKCSKTYVAKVVQEAKPSVSPPTSEVV